MTLSVNNPHKEPVPPLIKIREVAKVLSVSRHTVHTLIQCGDLKAERINPTRKKRRKGIKPRTHVRVTRDSLLEFYQGRFGHPLNRVLANPFAMAA